MIRYASEAKRTIRTLRYVEREAVRMCRELRLHIAFLTLIRPLVLDQEEEE